MTSPAQVANDLMAQADRLTGRGQDDLVKSLRRGARVIRELMQVQMQLEAAAEAEAVRFERYRNGDDR